LQVQGPAVAATPKRDIRRGEAAPATAVVTAQVDSSGDYVLVARYPSGAMIFLPPADLSAPSRRSRAAAKAVKPRQLQFHVPLVDTVDERARRSLLGDAARGVIEFFLAKIGEAVAATAVNLAEAAIWRALGREEGLYKITRQTLASGTLKAARGKIGGGPDKRALLFLHGTFSTTAAAFAELAQSNFFTRLAARYGDEIYGFDHFTVSSTPEQNAKDILKKVTPGVTIDVVTHSRGGLVLRTLVELNSGSPKFDLGNAVLVACPNEGTALATADRWNETIGWFANVMDMFPPNPVTSNAAIIAHWIAWLVKHGLQAADGLGAMQVNGPQITRLQLPPAPALDKYSALVSNYQPDENILARAVDLGIDAFFKEANDLVVPSVGGWRIDKTLASIPASRVGCYGHGGNISGVQPVTHTGFFDRPQTVDFIVNALTGTLQTLPAIDLSVPLPAGLRRQFQPDAAALARTNDQSASTTAPENSASTQIEKARKDLVIARRSAELPPFSSIFELTVIDPTLTGADDESTVPYLLASYRGARVAVPFRTRKRQIPSDRGTERREWEADQLRTRWAQLFAHHRTIKKHVAGGGAAPNDADLKSFGELLFETLFPGPVLRLYDAARAREREKLFMVFTSMIPWVADMPWEFARDPNRGTFLATEDVYFIRNVLTSTPVDIIPPKERLKMLIAVAQPRNVGELSWKAEADALRAALSDEHIPFDICVETGVTPEKLHFFIAHQVFDIVHFIGHGYWDGQRSGLVLENNDHLAEMLPDRALREIVSGRGVRLLFLNACDTGRSVTVDDKVAPTVTGVAQDLFGRGVPNVIANQLSVDDRAAVAFATTFYGFIAAGKTIAQAAREARIAASYRKGGQSIDWAIPVVYARDPDDRFVHSSPH
jgi:hypothetical protein